MRGTIKRTGVDFAAFFILIFIMMSLLCDRAAAADLGIIEVESLQKTLGQWVVLDTRPQAAWQSGHIPGALSFSWEDYTKSSGKDIKYSLQPPQELAKALGGAGINERTPIVVYADDKSWGAEGWGCWVLAWLGHQGPVRLLVGGVRSWQDKQCLMTSGPETPARKPVPYHYLLDPRANIQTVEIVKGVNNLTLIDTRSTLEMLTGRIPGAVHIPWTKFYVGPEHRPLAAAALKKLLQDNGANLQRPVVYYCAAGVRSGFAWFVHQLSGLPPARNYAGGMEAWKQASH